MPTDPDDDPLPEPHDGMTPDEKGALLLRYVAIRRAVARKEKGRHAVRWARLAFLGVNLRKGMLRGASLEGANLRRSCMAGAELTGADLDAADCRDADLRGARLSGTTFLCGDLRGADLRGCTWPSRDPVFSWAFYDARTRWPDEPADETPRFYRNAILIHRDYEISGQSLAGRFLDDSDLRGIVFRRTDLRGASFRGSDLRGAEFLVEPALLEGADFGDAIIDAHTYRRSAWTPEFLASLRHMGARFDRPKEFPLEARAAMVGPGLTLTFDTRLHRFDATAFDALIAEVLGRDTDVTIEERSNLDADIPAFIRINGSRVDDLVAVAEAFYNRVWAKRADAEDAVLRRTITALEVLFGPRLNEMRDRLVKVEASTNLFADEEVREAITDMAAEHVLAKRKKSFQTTFQKITEGLAKEAPKKLIGAFIGEKAVEALGEVLGGVAETAADETMDVLRDPADADRDGS